jgi:hypothetical protein
MTGINFTGLDHSLFLVGAGNATDSILYISITQLLLTYHLWLIAITVVLLALFLYTKDLLLALTSMTVLAVNMYVIDHTDFEDVTKLLLKAVFILLILFVALYTITQRRTPSTYST